MFLRTDEMERYVADYEGASVGFRDHVNHTDCPAGVDRKKRLYLTRANNGWLFYCHHCGSKGMLKDESIKRMETLLSSFSIPEPRMNEMVSVLNNMEGEVSIKEWPSEARLWWLGYGLDQSDADWHNVQWYGDRLWLKARGHAWQGRGFDGQKQKYLTYVCSATTIPIFLVDSEDVVILTEDIVSSYKVFKAGFNSLPLLGTKLRPVTLNYLSKYYSRCIIWLDDDVAGMLGTTEVSRALSPLMDVKRIMYKQPKEVGLYKLQEMIRYA